MKVFKEELEDGALQQLVFRADAGEGQDALKSAVDSWLKSNYPGMNWKEFFDRLIVLDASRIIISMV